MSTVSSSGFSQTYFPNPYLSGITPNPSILDLQHEALFFEEEMFFNAALGFNDQGIDTSLPAFSQPTYSCSQFNAEDQINAKLKNESEKIQNQARSITPPPIILDP